MPSVRTLVAPKTLAGSIAAAAALTGFSGVGSANAYEIVSVPGGVEITLNHDETNWVRDNRVGSQVARLPYTSASSFGSALENASHMASTYPQGYVVFSAYGPLDQLGGYMYAMKE